MIFNVYNFSLVFARFGIKIEPNWGNLKILRFTAKGKGNADRK
jgi:hypothetical protein